MPLIFEKQNFNLIQVSNPEPLAFHAKCKYQNNLNLNVVMGFMFAWNARGSEFKKLSL